MADEKEDEKKEPNWVDVFRELDLALTKVVQLPTWNALLMKANPTVRNAWEEGIITTTDFLAHLQYEVSRFR